MASINLQTKRSGYSAEMDELERASRDEIIALQTKRLASTLTRVYDNVAHYLDPYTICQPAGVPRQLVLFRSHQITQFPGYVTIVNEAGGHNFRVVYTDGRPHPGSGVKLWMGDSRGRWDGNTLVIETTNFNGRAWLDSGGTPGSDQLRVVERLTLIDADTLHYSATVEDPHLHDRALTVRCPPRY